MANEAENNETIDTTETENTEETKAPKAPALPKRKEIMEMDEFTQGVFTDFTDLSPAEQALFMAHATEEMRYNGVITSRQLAQSEDEADQLAVGDEVNIQSGNVKYIGSNGVVTKVRRVRVFVKPEGADRAVYLFRSDVTPISVIDEESGEDEEAIAVNE